MKARMLLALSISAALAALAPAVASAQLTTGPFPCSAGCVGSYSGKFVGHDERPTYSYGTETTDVTWTWSESLIDLGDGKSAWLLNSSSASGTVTYSGAPVDNCTFTSQLAPDAAQRWTIAIPGGAKVVDDPAIFGAQRDGMIEVTTDAGSSTIDLNPSGVQGYLIGATQPHEEMQTTMQGPPARCSTSPGVAGTSSGWSFATPGDPGPCYYTTYSAGETLFLPASTSPVTVDSSCLGHIEGSPNSHASITESLTFQGAPPGFVGQPGPVGPSAPQQPIAGPPTPRNLDKRKDIAATDLKPAAKDAIVPCTAVALGSVASATRGGMLTGLAKRGDASSPESLPDAGDALGSAWRDLCDQAVGRLQHDYKTANDPPVDDWHTFARLAKKPKKKQPSKSSCARKRGQAAKALCALRADQAAALAAAKRAGTAAAAIETTVDRETAALAAGSTTVAGQQGQTAAALGGQFDAAVAALGKAEVSRTAHLKALGLKLAPTKAATKKGQALILKRLAPSGITLVELAPNIGSVLGS
jgi:hypothetical protein